MTRLSLVVGQRLAPTRLERELTTLPPLEPRTAPVDLRTNEGKRCKAELLRELIELRERGYLISEIGAALGVAPSTLAVWLIVARRPDLAHIKHRAGRPPTGHCHTCGRRLEITDGRQRRKKYCGPDCVNEMQRRQMAEQRADVGGSLTIIQRQFAEARRERVMACRAEYRRCRDAGKPLPWHLLRREPDLSVEQRAEMAQLLDAQRRDGERIGQRPWLVSCDAPITSGDPDEPWETTLYDTLAMREHRAESEIEALMIENGGVERHHVARMPWRVRRPVREMYPDADAA